MGREHALRIGFRHCYCLAVLLVRQFMSCLDLRGRIAVAAPPGTSASDSGCSLPDPGAIPVRSPVSPLPSLHSGVGRFGGRSCSVAAPLHNRDLFLRQPVQFIHQRVNVLLSGIDLPLSELPVGGAPESESPTMLAQRLWCVSPGVLLPVRSSKSWTVTLLVPCTNQAHPLLRSRP